MAGNAIVRKEKKLSATAATAMRLSLPKAKSGTKAMAIFQTVKDRKRLLEPTSSPLIEDYYFIRVSRLVELQEFF